MPPASTPVYDLSSVFVANGLAPHTAYHPTGVVTPLNTVSGAGPPQCLSVSAISHHPPPQSNTQQPTSIQFISSNNPPNGPTLLATTVSGNGNGNGRFNSSTNYSNGYQHPHYSYNTYPKTGNTGSHGHHRTNNSSSLSSHQANSNQPSNGNSSKPYRYGGGNSSGSGKNYNSPSTQHYHQPQFGAYHYPGGPTPPAIAQTPQVAIYQPGGNVYHSKNSHHHGNNGVVAINSSTSSVVVDPSSLVSNVSSNTSTSSSSSTLSSAISICVSNANSSSKDSVQIQSKSSSSTSSSSSTHHTHSSQQHSNNSKQNSGGSTSNFNSTNQSSASVNINAKTATNSKQNEVEQSGTKKSNNFQSTNGNGQRSVRSFDRSNKSGNGTGYRSKRENFYNSGSNGGGGGGGGGGVTSNGHLSLQTVSSSSETDGNIRKTERSSSGKYGNRHQSTSIAGNNVNKPNGPSNRGRNSSTTASSVTQQSEQAFNLLTTAFPPLPGFPDPSNHNQMDKTEPNLNETNNHVGASVGTAALSSNTATSVRLNETSSLADVVKGHNFATISHQQQSNTSAVSVVDHTSSNISDNSSQPNNHQRARTNSKSSTFVGEGPKSATKIGSTNKPKSETMNHHSPKVVDDHSSTTYQESSSNSIPTPNELPTPTISHVVQSTSKPTQTNDLVTQTKVEHASIEVVTSESAAKSRTSSISHQQSIDLSKSSEFPMVDESSHLPVVNDCHQSSSSLTYAQIAQRSKAAKLATAATAMSGVAPSTMIDIVSNSIEHSISASPALPTINQANHLHKDVGRVRSIVVMFLIQFISYSCL